MQWLNLVTELCELYCAVQINGLLRESVQKFIIDLENSIKYSENYWADLLLRIASVKLLGWGQIIFAASHLVSSILDLIP